MSLNSIMPVIVIDSIIRICKDNKKGARRWQPDLGYKKRNRAGEGNERERERNI